MLPLENSASASHWLCGKLRSKCVTMFCLLIEIIATARQFHQQIETARAVLILRIRQCCNLAGVSRFNFRSQAAAATANCVPRLFVPGWTSMPAPDIAPRQGRNARLCSRHPPSCAVPLLVSDVSAPVAVSLARAISASVVSGYVSNSCFEDSVRILRPTQCLATSPLASWYPGRPVVSRSLAAALNDALRSGRVIQGQEHIRFELRNLRVKNAVGIALRKPFQAAPRPPPPGLPS